MRRLFVNAVAYVIVASGAVVILALSTALTWQLLTWAFGIGVGIGGGCSGV